MTTHSIDNGRDRAARELAQQYATTMARTADLVRKLTSLADRYEAAGESGDGRAGSRGASVRLMRDTADAGRQLIRALAPPALKLEEMPEPSPTERADRARSRDAYASARDAAAEDRDLRASLRDRRVRELDQDEVDFPGRFLAACDRDQAAGDRAAAFDDRRAAQADRDVAAAATPLALDSQARTYALVAHLQGRAIVRQAQGVLMDRAGMTAGEAFEALLLSASGHLTIESVAEHVIRHADLPGVDDLT